MSAYRPWYLSLTGFLLVASPGSAQAQTEEPVKLIYAVWQDATGAENTMKHMGKAAKDQIEAYAVLRKDKDGKVDVTQRHHQDRGYAGVQSSETLDRAIAQLSAPAASGTDSASSDSASGYAPSGQPSRLSEEDLKKVVGMFGPGESVLLLMSPQPAVSEIQRSLGIGAQGAPEVVVLEVKK